MTNTLCDQPDENAPERPASAYVIFSNRRSTPRAAHILFRSFRQQKSEKNSKAKISPSPRLLRLSVSAGKSLNQKPETFLNDKPRLPRKSIMLSWQSTRRRRSMLCIRNTWPTSRQSMLHHEQVSFTLTGFNSLLIPIRRETYQARASD